MNLQEIINRPDNHPKQLNEVLFVIREYVKERKGVEINPIIPPSNLSIFALKLAEQMMLDALVWYRNK